MPKKGKGKRSLADTFTEKGAPSLSSTGSARVNFFFKSVRGLDKDEGRLHTMLLNSWNEDALDTLKLIFQTRDCRGGKGEKAIFRASICWLAHHHPEALQKNIQHISFYGSWKDLFSLMGTSFENTVLDMFAEQLRKDLEVVNSMQDGKKLPISLCAKWAPTESHKDDRVSKAASKLAKRLFNGSKTHLKDYRKTYLTPLRAYLQVTEVFMCSQHWHEIDYSRVPSRCMNINRKAFVKHDSERFSKFIEDAKSGKVSIKGKQMFPHELAKYYFTTRVLDDVVELQWKAIVDDVKKQSSLSDSIVLSDVSGSMEGTPMEVSVALGLLISEVTAPPFTNVVITFHENPSFHVVSGTSLMERVQNIKSMPWGGTTNFQAVFDLILSRAQQHKLPASSMPKRLFVLSDMQFDVADGGGRFMTNHENIRIKYERAGYPMPQIVYWNLRADTKDFPVPSNERGVMLVSGFSPSILKDLVETGDFADPFTTMKRVIDSERYKIITL
jgi:hypothetical protein